MLSSGLVEMIQSHAEELMGGLVRKIQTHPNTRSYHHLSGPEVLSRSYIVYKNLGAWMGGKPQEEIRRHYEQLGQIRLEESIPLHEVIYALTLTKNHLFEFVRTNGLAGSMLEIYAEQELERRVANFFDNAIYYTAWGYEKAAAEKHWAEQFAPSA
jgi:hypothetical protein